MFPNATFLRWVAPPEAGPFLPRSKLAQQQDGVVDEIEADFRKWEIGAFDFLVSRLRNSWS